MKKIFIFIILLFFLVSCSENKKSAFFFPEKGKLQTTYFPLEELLDPSDITINGKYLFCSSWKKKDPVITIFSLPNLKYKGPYGTVGRGPDEFSHYSTFCRSTDNMLYIYGYTPLIIKGFNIKEDPFELQHQRTIDLDFFDVLNDINIINDSLLVYFFIPNLTIKKYNLNQKRFTGKISFDNVNVDSPSRSPDYGEFITKDSLLIYFYRFKRQIDIYNINTMKLVKCIVDNDVTFSVDDIINPFYHFSLGFAGDNYIFALYRGHFAAQSSEKRGYLEIYDYDLNPIKRYEIDDIPSRGFVVDESNKMVIGFSSSQENKFVVYNY